MEGGGIRRIVLVFAMMMISIMVVHVSFKAPLDTDAYAWNIWGTLACFTGLQEEDTP